MKVGIDISQTVYPRGVGRYTRELVSHLLKIDPSVNSGQVQNEYVLFGSSLRQQETLKNFTNSLKPSTFNFSTKIFPIPPTLLEFLFNQIHFSIDPFIGGVDVFHSSDWTQPKTKAKKVTTVHDMIAFKFPHLFDPKTNAVQKRRLEWVKEEVDKIIAVSQNTKKDIVEILKIPTEKIEVIYEAASHVFYPRKANEIETIKRKFGIKGEYLLAVTTRSSQKFGKLFEAFQTIKKDFDVTLVVVGETSGFSNENKIVKTGYLEDKELASLYSGAVVFVFSSFYEGFGLPVLEAIACGAPVVTSATSSLPEVAGDAAVYVDPNSEHDTAEGIKKVLMNTKVAQKLREKGLAQAAKFSWEKAASQTLKIYEEVARF